MSILIVFFTGDWMRYANRYANIKNFQFMTPATPKWFQY